MFVRPATKAVGQSLPPINTQENASMRPGFVEGGTIDDEGASEILPEGRPIPTSPLRVKKPSREVENAIRYAAETTGVDYDKLLDMAFVESGYNPNAVNTKSKAIGLFQFVPNTWKGMIKNYGEQYPLLTSGPTDPFANALAGALLYKENTKSIGSDTLDDAYLAHFAGAPVAKKLLRAPQQSAAASFFTEQGRLQNKEILFNDPKTMTKPRTVEEVRNLFAERLSANRQGQTLAQASTALDQQKTATITNNIVSNRNAAPPPAQTQSTYIPYAVSPRDDSRQAINHVNAT
jgi:soluble lytic murein transglycosylase-like protein